MSSSGLRDSSSLSSCMHAKLGTFVVFACSSFIKLASFVLYSSMFCRICSPVALKFELVSESISYATWQWNKFVGIGKTLAMSHPAASNLKPESSLFSLMCTLGSSSIFVCWERCSAASHDERSMSVSGKMECWVQHRESMSEVVRAFISTKCECKILIGSCLGDI